MPRHCYPHPTAPDRTTPRNLNLYCAHQGPYQTGPNLAVPGLAVPQLLNREVDDLESSKPRSKISQAAHDSGLLQGGLYVCVV